MQELAHATAGSFLGVNGVVWFWIISIIGIGGVIFSLSRRFQVLRVAGDDNRFDRIGERIKKLLVYALGQKKMFDDPFAGFYHVLIFYGFLVVALRTAAMVIEGASAGWELPLLHTQVGHLYLFSKDVFQVLVLLGLAFAAFRRGIQRPQRIVQSFGAWLVLGLIGILMLTDLFSEGARIAAGMEASYLPVSSLCAVLLQGMSEAGLQTTYTVLWWIHLVTLYYFANELPYSKHFHVYTSLFNVFFADLNAPGKLATMDLENIDEDTRFGAVTVTDFTWKQVLDLYTCTECGRCRELCPTTLTGKPLEPVLFTKSVRDQVYREQQQIISDPGGSGCPAETELIPDVVNPDVVWACTTCRWCERACPLEISYVDKLVELRRNLVLEKAEFPEEAQSAFKGYEVNGNPWQLAGEERAAWAEELEIPLLAEAGDDYDYLFFVGSPGSYDDNGKKVSQALAKIARAAGVKLAILGPEEVSCGDAARRLGNEYLYQMLAMQNIETMNGYGVKRVVTNCPHVFNTLKNEYPDLGGSYEVVHGTQLVANLIRSGKIRLNCSLDLDVAFHDPCYLGRTNGVLREPRFLLNAIPGLRIREAELNSERSMCCGAGGGRMWLEEKLGDRINQTRYGQLKASGTSDVCVACPYCYSMLSDAQQETGDEEAKTYDVIQLVAEAMGE
jgi:Fe-S oxidoreductase